MALPGFFSSPITFKHFLNLCHQTLQLIKDMVGVVEATRTLRNPVKHCGILRNSTEPCETLRNTAELYGTLRNTAKYCSELIHRQTVAEKQKWLLTRHVGSVHDPRNSREEDGEHQKEVEFRLLWVGVILAIIGCKNKV